MGYPRRACGVVFGAVVHGGFLASLWPLERGVIPTLRTQRRAAKRRARLGLTVGAGGEPAAPGYSSKCLISSARDWMPSFR